MKIALLGAAGQLGRDLAPRLPGEVTLLTRAELNLSEPSTIEPALKRLEPDWVINCAAYNFVDKAEAEPEQAFTVNSWGVRALAAVCNEIGSRIAHVSTDYVFGLDAERTTPLLESDSPGPVSVYGISKLAGEYFVRAASPSNLIVRTCGLYGAWGSGGKGGNFVETMKKLASQGKPLKIVNDQRCTPTYTVDLAETIAALLRKQAHGLFHVTNSGDCTWYEFATEIFRLTGLRPEVTPISSAEFGAAAKRPNYSVLTTNKLEPLSVHPPRHWREAVKAYLEEGRRNPEQAA